MRLVTGLVKDRLLECMGQVLQQALSKGRSQLWDMEARDEVNSDEELTEVRRVPNIVEGCRGIDWKWRGQKRECGESL